jgi:hypothetical protein
MSKTRGPERSRRLAEVLNETRHFPARLFKG